MKKRINLILITLSCLGLMTVSGNAQGPGLSGKRFSTFYNLEYAGKMVYSDFDNNKGDYYNEINDGTPSLLKSIINFRHNVQVEYNINRKVTIGAFGSYFREGFGIVEPRLFSKNYQSFSYGIAVKLFSLKKGGLAPLGRYFSLKIFNNYNIIHYRGISNIYGDNFRTNETTYSSPRISVVFGKQGILTGKVLFNVAVEAGILFYEEIDSSALVPFYNIGYQTDDLMRSLNTAHLFRLTFGAGINPF